MGAIVTVLSRRELLLSGMISSALASSIARGAIASESLGAQIDTIARKAIGAGTSPGLQIAIWKTARPVLSRAYGLANTGTKSPVTEKNVFRIGSLTKQFTAAAIVRLASDKKLSLTDNVSNYLPFMSALKPVTLLELMHHTAGLHSDETEEPVNGRFHTPKTQIELAQLVASQKTPFDFDPGTAWLYSNANYIVLGAVIEAVNRQPFDQAMFDLVFKPLGLGATAVDRSDSPSADQVHGYTAVEGPTIGFEDAAFIEIAEAGGAGAMRSTASDLCSWHAQLLSHKLFDSEHLGLMLAPGKLRDGRLSGANRFRAEDANYGATQYACGLLVSPASDPHPNILHYGFINGFATMLQTWTNAAVTMAVLCNSDVGPATPFRNFRQAVSKTLLQTDTKR